MPKILNADESKEAVQQAHEILKEKGSLTDHLELYIRCLSINPDLLSEEEFLNYQNILTQGKINVVMLENQATTLSSQYIRGSNLDLEEKIKRWANIIDAVDETDALNESVLNIVHEIANSLQTNTLDDILAINVVRLSKLLTLSKNDDICFIVLEKIADLLNSKDRNFYEGFISQLTQFFRKALFDQENYAEGRYSEKYLGILRKLVMREVEFPYSQDKYDALTKALEFVPDIYFDPIDKNADINTLPRLTDNLNGNVTNLDQYLSNISTDAKYIIIPVHDYAFEDASRRKQFIELPRNHFSLLIYNRIDNTYECIDSIDKDLFRFISELTFVKDLVLQAAPNSNIAIKNKLSQWISIANKIMTERPFRPNAEKLLAFIKDQFLLLPIESLDEHDSEQAVALINIFKQGVIDSSSCRDAIHFIASKTEWIKQRSEEQKTTLHGAFLELIAYGDNQDSPEFIPIPLQGIQIIKGNSRNAEFPFTKEKYEALEKSLKGRLNVYFHPDPISATYKDGNLVESTEAIDNIVRNNRRIDSAFVVIPLKGLQYLDSTPYDSDFPSRNHRRVLVYDKNQSSFNTYDSLDGNLIDQLKPVLITQRFQTKTIAQNLLSNLSDKSQFLDILLNAIKNRTDEEIDHLVNALYREANESGRWIELEDVMVNTLGIPARKRQPYEDRLNALSNKFDWRNRSQKKEISNILWQAAKNFLSNSTGKLEISPNISKETENWITDIATILYDMSAEARLPSSDSITSAADIALSEISKYRKQLLKAYLQPCRYLAQGDDLEKSLKTSQFEETYNPLIEVVNLKEQTINERILDQIVNLIKQENYDQAAQLFNQRLIRILDKPEFKDHLINALTKHPDFNLFVDKVYDLYPTLTLEGEHFAYWSRILNNRHEIELTDKEAIAGIIKKSLEKQSEPIEIPLNISTKEYIFIKSLYSILYHANKPIKDGTLDELIQSAENSLNKFKSDQDWRRLTASAIIDAQSKLIRHTKNLDVLTQQNDNQIETSDRENESVQLAEVMLYVLRAIKERNFNSAETILKKSARASFSSESTLNSYKETGSSEIVKDENSWEDILLFCNYLTESDSLDIQQKTRMRKVLQEIATIKNFLSDIETPLVFETDDAAINARNLLEQAINSEDFGIFSPQQKTLKAIAVLYSRFYDTSEGVPEEIDLLRTEILGNKKEILKNNMEGITKFFLEDIQNFVSKELEQNLSGKLDVIVSTIVKKFRAGDIEGSKDLFENLSANFPRQNNISITKYSSLLASSFLKNENFEVFKDLCSHYPDYVPEENLELLNGIENQDQQTKAVVEEIIKSLSDKFKSSLDAKANVDAIHRSFASSEETTVNLLIKIVEKGEYTWDLIDSLSNDSIWLHHLTNVEGLSEAANERFRVEDNSILDNLPEHKWQTYIDILNQHDITKENYQDIGPQVSTSYPDIPLEHIQAIQHIAFIVAEGVIKLEGSYQELKSVISERGRFLKTENLTTTYLDQFISPVAFVNASKNGTSEIVDQIIKTAFDGTDQSVKKYWVERIIDHPDKQTVNNLLYQDATAQEHLERSLLRLEKDFDMAIETQPNCLAIINNYLKNPTQEIDNVLNPISADGSVSSEDVKRLRDIGTLLTSIPAITEVTNLDEARIIAVSRMQQSIREDRIDKANQFVTAKWVSKNSEYVISHVAEKILDAMRTESTRTPGGSHSLFELGKFLVENNIYLNPKLIEALKENPDWESLIESHEKMKNSRNVYDISRAKILKTSDTAQIPDTTYIKLMKEYFDTLQVDKKQATLKWIQATRTFSKGIQDCLNQIRIVYEQHKDEKSDVPFIEAKEEALILLAEDFEKNKKELETEIVDDIMKSGAQHFLTEVQQSPSASHKELEAHDEKLISSDAEIDPSLVEKAANIISVPLHYPNIADDEEEINNIHLSLADLIIKNDLEKDGDFVSHVVKQLALKQSGTSIEKQNSLKKEIEKKVSTLITDSIKYFDETYDKRNKKNLDIEQIHAIETYGGGTLVRFNNPGNRAVKPIHIKREGGEITWVLFKSTNTDNIYHLPASAISDGGTKLSLGKPCTIWLNNPYAGQKTKDNKSLQTQTQSHSSARY